MDIKEILKVKAYQVVGERIDGGVDILEESDDQKQAWLDFAWHSKEELRKPDSPYKSVTLRKGR
jgi:hypothetical protein